MRPLEKELEIIGKFSDLHSANWAHRKLGRAMFSFCLCSVFSFVSLSLSLSVPVGPQIVCESGI